jgi:hypothetical protein
MDRPGCHAQTRRVVSVYLASLADAAPLPECPGVSTRALRSALRMMCRIAQNDGSMRYGRPMRANGRKSGASGACWLRSAGEQTGRA